VKFEKDNGLSEEDMQDPEFQAMFVASRLKSGDHDKTNAILSDPNVSREAAAHAFLTGYLKPAAGPMAARAAR
jgi:hypothetical protein